MDSKFAIIKTGKKYSSKNKNNIDKIEHLFYSNIRANKCSW
jgi:hypothetical protein